MNTNRVIFITALLTALLIVLTSTVYADCDCCCCCCDYCSRHGGVVCADGETKCKDGSALSAKGCDGCGGASKSEQAKEQPSQVKEYKREDWPHWTDMDNDCQDTRAEILQRDNVGTIKWKRNKPCNVSWGKWVCPYTGKTFEKASDVGIDHIVPLSHAHKTGAANWSWEKKRAFVNDPMNLLVVDDSAKQEKGDKAPYEWKPRLKSYWPEYARKWRAVKKKYGLKISEAEEIVLRSMDGERARLYEQMKKDRERMRTKAKKALERMHTITKKNNKVYIKNPKEP